MSSSKKNFVLTLVAVLTVILLTLNSENILAKGSDDAGSSSNTSSNDNSGSSSNSTEIRQEPEQRQEPEVRGNTQESQQGQEAEIRREPEIRGNSQETETSTRKLQFQQSNGQLEVETGENQSVKVQTKTEGEIEIKAEDNQIKIKSGNSEASVSNPVVFDDNTKQLFIKIGNDLLEVKLLPHQAAEVVKNKGLETEIEKIELKPNSQAGVEDKAVFQVRGQKTGKFLGLFKTTSEVEVEVGATSGNILKEDKPFLQKLFNLFIK